MTIEELFKVFDTEVDVAIVTMAEQVFGYHKRMSEKDLYLGSGYGIPCELYDMKIIEIQPKDGYTLIVV